MIVSAAPQVITSSLAARVMTSSMVVQVMTRVTVDQILIRALMSRLQPAVKLENSNRTERMNKSYKN